MRRGSYRNHSRWCRCARVFLASRRCNASPVQEIAFTLALIITIGFSLVPVFVLVGVID